MTIGTHRVWYAAPAVVDVTDLSCDVTDATIHHGRDDPTGQPEASTCTLNLPGAVPDGMDVGSRIIVETQAPDATWSRRFTGTVTDLNATWDTGANPVTGEPDTVPSTTVTAAGPLADLGRRVIGAAPWPQELDGARVSRVLGVAAGALGSWSYNGTSPDGWTDNFFGTQQAILSAAPDGLRMEWVPGAASASGFAWRSTAGVEAGKRYTCSIEVLVPVGQPPVRLSNPFVADGPFIVPSPEWQTITLTYTAPDTAPRAMGPQAVIDAARPAGTYCYCRSWRLYAADANPLSLGVIDPGTVAILPRDVDAQRALDLAQSVADDGAGILWETRDGALSYADADHRKSTPRSLAVESCDVLLAPVYSRTVAGLINDVSIGYGVASEGSEQARYAQRNDKSIARYGLFSLSAATQLASATDAAERASVLVGRSATPAWNVSNLPLDLRLLDDATTQVLLGLDMHDLAGLLDLPSGAPDESSLWVEGWTEHLAHDVHEMVLAVSAYCRTSPPPEWDEAKATETWDTIGGRFLSATNLVTNPSAELASGTVVVRTNANPNPTVNPALSPSWQGFGGGGGTITLTRMTGQTGWSFGVATSARTTWTVSPSGIGGGIGFGTVNVDLLVTPGRYYGAFMQVRASRAQRMVAEIQWWNGAAYLSSSYATPVILAANTVTNIAVDAGLAPANATNARVLFLVTAGTGAVVWAPGDWVEATNGHFEETDQHLQPGGGPTAEYNAIHGTFSGGFSAGTYGPDYTYAYTGAVGASASVQQAPAPVGFATGANCVVGVSTDRAHSRTKSLRVMWFSAGATGAASVFPMVGASVLVIGKTYTASAWVFVPTGSPLVRIDVNNGGVFPVGTDTGATKDAWVRLTVTFVAAVTSPNVRAAVLMANSTRGDDGCYVDDVQVEEGSFPTDYFDGATADTLTDDYDWTGTADASTSVHYVRLASGGPTWDDAVCLGPIPSAGRWSDVPAALRWDQIPVATTWDTWAG